MNRRTQRIPQSLKMLLIGFLAIAGGNIAAQETGYFSHYQLEPVLMNPAATGFHGGHELLAGYNYNYSAFSGAPKTFTALYHGSVGDNIGLGIQFLSDRIGAQRQIGGQINYAFRFQIEDAVLSLGLYTGLQQFRIKAQDDPLLDPNDVLLQEAQDGYLLFDGGIGLYGEVSEKFYFGVSLPNLIKTRLKNIEGDLNLKDIDHFAYAITLGARFDVADYDFRVEPSVTVRDLRYSPFAIDALLKLAFLDDQLVGGVGYSLGEESQLSVLLGTRIDALHIYYSYGVHLGDFQKYNNGSHELTLAFKFPAKKAEPMAEPMR